MIKKVFMVLFMTIFILGSSYSISNAEMAYEYDFYSISDKEIIYDNGKAIVSFTMTNKTDKYYPELYALPTLKISNGGEYDMFYSAYYDYDMVKFSLKPNEKKYLTINCKLPEQLPSKKLMISVQIHAITHRVSNGNESFYLDLKGNDFNGFIESDLFSHWKLTDGSYILSGTGPNVDSDTLPQISLKLKSTFEKDKKIFPQYVIYERSPIYNNQAVYNKLGEGILIKPEEGKEILLDVPAFIKPESYLIKFNFVDESGIPVSYLYDYRYVIKGESAKVSKITLETLENECNISAYIYGPADRSEIDNAKIEILIYDENDVLINKYSENVKLTSSARIVSCLLKNIETSNINVKVRVLSNGKELAYKKEKLDTGIKKGEKVEMFKDIIGTPYEEAVKTLNGLGIINGYPDGTFKPDNLVTRAEFSTIATKLMELNINDNAISNFTDIENHWGKPFINTLYEAKLVNGYPDGTFKPQNNVTYAETVTILLNALGYRNDVSEKESKWPNNYIEKNWKISLDEFVKIEDYMVPATRGNIALLVLKAYILK